MKDIARELDISVMTVSRALNNRKEVDKVTRARIQQTARRLGFRPNFAARTLQSRRSMMIGLVVPDLSHSYFAEIAQAAQAVALERGYFLVISDTRECPETEIRILDMLVERQVDGLIVHSRLPRSYFSALRKRSSVRCVLLDRNFRQSIFPEVICDDEHVGFMATDHLIRCGYRNVLHVAGPKVYTSEERARGYLAAHAHHGREAAPIVWSGFLEQDGERVAPDILAMNPRPDAIFASNDPIAIGLLSLFQKRGVKVPDDIALIGAGDIKFSSMIAPALSTVAFPKAQIGTEAIRLLLDEDGAQTKRIVLPTELVLRDSCRKDPLPTDVRILE